jgi:hypothetical protein
MVEETLEGVLLQARGLLDLLLPVGECRQDRRRRMVTMVLGSRLTPLPIDEFNSSVVVQLFFVYSRSVLQQKTFFSSSIFFIIIAIPRSLFLIVINRTLVLDVRAISVSSS